MKKRKSNINRKQQQEKPNASVNLDLDDEQRKLFEIKKCFVKLTPMNIETSAMDETPPPAEVVKKRPGRKPKNWAAKQAAANAAASTPQPAKKLNEKDDDNNDSIENLDESSEKADKPEKLSKSERKLAKKAAIEAIIASGGRGKRTPKPNPKYMDEPVVSAKQMKDESADSENAEGEDGDDEMQSSDEPRHEGPLKKRMLQKAGIRSGPGRKPLHGIKATPSNAGRKTLGAIPIKRKIIDVDIDIDDDHGKQLFLAAKRRLTHSPSNSDDDLHMRKGKNAITDALAAKLREKFPDDHPMKRSIGGEQKTFVVSRARVMDKSKTTIQKNALDKLGVRKRKRTDDTETSDDDITILKEASDQEATSPKNINRRKTQHTKILSDDKVIRASVANATALQGGQRRITQFTTITKQPISKQSPLTQNRLLQATTTKTYSISTQPRTGAPNKPAILRPPPRILNSTLCKPTNKATVPSHTLVTKLVTKDDYEHDLNKKRNNNIISSRSKENNVISYTYTEKDGKMVPKKTIVQLSPQQKLLQQQKLAQQRRAATLPVVRGQSNQTKIISTSEPIKSPTSSKRIRKITCFETWYVIKMIEAQAKLEKSTLSLSLMQIGNEIKKIELPSSEWTYKILLQPLSKQMLAARQTKVNQESLKAEEKVAEKKSDETTEDAKNDVKSENESDEKKATDVSEKESDSEKPEAKDDDTKGDKKASDDDVKAIKDEKPNTDTDTSLTNVHDVYTGEVHDPNINPGERQNYRPINIMFRRKCQNPTIRIQFDRTVILKNQTFYLNIDGKNVKLVASPQSIETYDDIKMLLQIVNDVSLNSCCVELATHIV